MAVTVYNGHNVANMSLNAVTIGVESNAPVDGGTGSDQWVNHEVILSIRVHTAFGNAAHAQQATIEILDAIITKLQRNINLSNNYRVMGFSAASYREEFPESMTKGGQVNISLHKLQNYTQE